MRISDWSSDVCSSDLTDPRAGNGTTRTALLSSRHPPRSIDMRRHLLLVPFLVLGARSALAQDTPNSDDVLAAIAADAGAPARSEETTSELQSLMRNSYAAFCLKKNHSNDS